MQLEADIDDPRNLASAEVSYWAVKGNVGAVPDFVIKGGANIRARRIGSAK